LKWNVFESDQIMLGQKATIYSLEQPKHTAISRIKVIQIFLFNAVWLLSNDHRYLDFQLRDNDLNSGK